jgi:hypothetical protein
VVEHLQGTDFKPSTAKKREQKMVMKSTDRFSDGEDLRFAFQMLV